MKLLLTSAGLTNQSIINALKKLCKNPIKELKIGFIPTAANFEESDKSWLIKNYQECLDLKPKNFEIIDLSALSKEQIKKRLTSQDILFFGGGNTYHLLKWINQSKVKKLFPEILKNKVYVGISAGSMLVPNKINLSISKFLYSEYIGKTKYNGLNLIDIDIIPHYKTNDFPLVKDENINKVIHKIKRPAYAIDDDSAVIVNNGEIKIVSEGEYKEFNSQ